jgi:hypothetical protein
MSIAAQFHAAAEAARNFAALDNVSRLLWRAHAEGLLDDNATQAAAEAIEASRRLLRGPRASATQKRAYAPPRPCRSPDRTKSIARRRSVAASGSVPSKIAASFTLGEVAALSVIAREVQRQGRCALPIDAIAAMGGNMPHHRAKCAQTGPRARSRPRPRASAAGTKAPAKSRHRRVARMADLAKARQ